MKKVIALILAAAALLSLCACGASPTAGPDSSAGGGAAGSAQAGAAEPDEEIKYELTLAAEFLDLPEGMAYASAQCRLGDTVWLGGTAESGAALGPVSLDGKAGGLIPMPEGCEFVYAMCPYGDGIAVLAGASRRTSRTRRARSRLSTSPRDGLSCFCSTERSLCPRRSLNSGIPTPSTP